MRLVPLLLAPLLLAPLLLIVGCDAREAPRSDAPAAGDEETVIAVISRGFQHQFWQTVEEGSLAATRELGLAVSFEGPATESMVDIQIDLLQNSVVRRVDAILLAALDSNALVPAVEQAQAAGIPVATFDSGVEHEVVTHVGTNNQAAGARAARELAALLGGAGTVGLIIHDAESESGAGRRDGFVAEVRERYPEITVLPPRYGGGDHEISGQILRDLLREYPEMEGLFAANEGSAIGAARVLADLGRADIAFVGFDSAPEQLDYLETGVIDGLVVQDPYSMGYLGVYALHRYLRGEPVASRIETETNYLTEEELESRGVPETAETTSGPWWSGR